MKRIYTNIYLHFIGVLLVVGLATSWVFASGWRAAFLRESAKRLVRHAATLTAESFDHPDRRMATMRELARDFELDITVLAPDGQPLAVEGAALPALSAAERAEAPVGPLIVHHGRWIATAPITDPHTGALLGIVELSHLRRHRPPLPVRSLVTVALVLIIVAFATAPLARRISRPVEELTEATRRFGGGDLGYRVRLPRRADELAALSRAWNVMAERVEGLLRGQKELLANVSHELRSPLARIRVALALLPPDAAAQPRLTDVELDLDELDKLIEDVLTTSRLEAPGLPLALGPVAVEPLFAQLKERAAHDPLVGGKEVTTRAEPGLPLCADGALLRRALWNLMENAAKYGAPPIALSARRAGDTIELAVHDEGPGIPAAERERVLEPFYRADRAHTPGPARGFGLGLTLARRITEVHGGTITVGAGPEERGCTICMRLPIREI